MLVPDITWIWPNCPFLICGFCGVFLFLLFLFLLVFSERMLQDVLPSKCCQLVKVDVNARYFGTVIFYHKYRGYGFIEPTEAEIPTEKALFLSNRGVCLFELRMRCDMKNKFGTLKAIKMFVQHLLKWSMNHHCFLSMHQLSLAWRVSVWGLCSLEADLQWWSISDLGQGTWGRFRRKCWAMAFLF